MPHDITYKVHVSFEPERCAYDATSGKAKKLAKVISGIADKDKYVGLLCDYDWYKGQGDALEVSSGELTFHVGHCPQEYQLSPEMKTKLEVLGYTKDTLPRQPPGNGPDGWKFKWDPSQG